MCVLIPKAENTDQDVSPKQIKRRQRKMEKYWRKNFLPTVTSFTHRDRKTASHIKILSRGGRKVKWEFFKLFRAICPVLPMPCFSQTWIILQHIWAMGLALIPLRFRKHLVSGPQSPINKTPQHPPDLHGDIPQMEKVQDRHFLCSSL